MLHTNDRFIYAAILSKDTIDETIKCVTYSNDPEKTSRLKPIFVCTHQEEDDVFTPQVKLESLFGSKQSAKMNELRVTKLLCKKEHRSFLFAPEFLKMLHEEAQDMMMKSSRCLKWRSMPRPRSL